MKIITALFLTLVLTSATSLGANNIRRNIATVVVCGVGGAVLGLSTLSFYGQPQDHISNIYAGFLIGMAAGAGYLVMSKDNYDYSRQTFESHYLADLGTRGYRPPTTLQNKLFHWEYTF